MSFLNRYLGESFEINRFLGEKFREFTERFHAPGPVSAPAKVQLIQILNRCKAAIVEYPSRGASKPVFSFVGRINKDAGNEPVFRLRNFTKNSLVAQFVNQNESLIKQFTINAGEEIFLAEKITGSVAKINFPNGEYPKQTKAPNQNKFTISKLVDNICPTF